MKRWISLFACLALVAGLLAACASEAPVIDEDQPLRVSAMAEQTTADPAVAVSTGGDTLIYHLYENLMKWEDDGTGIAQLTEGIAQNYTTEENTDGSMVYTFTLRSDAVWSDGQPVTANDFVYAWQRLFSLDPFPADLSLLSLVEGYAAAYQAKDGSLLTGVEATDDQTLVVRLTAPCAYFLSEVCGGAMTMPLREDLVTAAGWEPGKVTDGAYTLTSLDSTGALLTRSETYYGAETEGPAAIQFSWDSGEAAYEELTAGELDFVADLPEDVAQTQAEEGTLQVDARASTYALLMNTKAAPFDNEFVRQAFAAAIDRDALVKAACSVTDTAATGFVPHGITNRNDQWDGSTDSGSTDDGTVTPDDLLEESQEEETTVWDYRTVGDAEAPQEEMTESERTSTAQDLMSQAGYPGGKNFPAVTFLYENTEKNQAVAEYLQQQWQTVLNVTVQLQPCTQEELKDAMLNGEYTMGAFQFEASYDDATAFLRRWRSTVANWAGNLINYSDTAYDLLIYAAEITASNAGREACLHDAEELLLNSCGVVPLYYGGAASQLADGLTGVYCNALGVYFFGNVTQS